MMDDSTDAGAAEIAVAEMPAMVEPGGEIIPETWWEKNEPMVLGASAIKDPQTGQFRRECIESFGRRYA